MNKDQKSKHTMSNCDEGYTENSELQRAFPCKSLHIPQKFIQFHNELESSAHSLLTPNLTKRTFGTSLSNVLDPICQSTLGKSLGEVIVDTPGTSLQAKPTASKQKVVF